MMSTQPKRKVLLVEDDLMWQVVVQHTLKETGEGYDFRCVTSAEQAGQQLAQGEKFDLILADQNLQGAMTGYDFWKKCKRQHPMIPFVMISGARRGPMIRLSGDAELPNFIEKDHEMDRFKAQLRTRLDQVKFKDQLPPEIPMKWGVLAGAVTFFTCLFFIWSHR